MEEKKEQMAHAALQSEDGLVGGDSEINDSVIKSCLLLHTGHMFFLLLHILGVVILPCHLK